MNVITRPRMTLDEFLAWEREQECAHEFDGERIIAMNGGSMRHHLIPGNVLFRLRTQLDPVSFLIFMAGVKIVHDGRVRYPDVIVAKTVPDTKLDIVSEPIVVFEVISSTSEICDTVVKNREYRANPSIQQYVIIRQDVAAITSWVRAGADWQGTLLVAGETVQFPSLGASIPVSALYEGVTLAEEPPP